MSKPGFIFVGASKAGSSWLYNYFVRHPGIFVPTAKDTYFFKTYYDKGVDWYEEFFAAAGPDQIAGEICHDYLHDREAIDRIAAEYPDIKLICSLRQPVDRVISTYLYAARHGLVDPNLKRHVSQKAGLFLEGRYADDLEHVYARFPRENVLVFLYDDLLDDPEALARRINDFLGAEHFDYPDIAKKVRAASKARSARVNSIGKKVAQRLRALGLHNVLGRLKNSALVQRLLYKEITVENTSYYKDLPSEQIDRYLDNIARLELLIDRSLEHWVAEINTHRAP
ncbi:sulfotransferase [uncultured Tateyamaria sp.]|uniref:sulfotransferase family protein n=1 Tax=uncultured Tateyamaria sp. TaxID=455651 RepID=UPI00260E7199|nr:sulfotransferase [uncultured Tateyamaria sp.]